MKVISFITQSILFAIEFFAAFVVGYLSIALCCMSIQVNDTATKGTYTVWMKSDGIHTDFVVEAKNDLMDWTSYFPLKNTKKQVFETSLIAIGWGDQGFFLNTPEWSDLTCKTAVEATFYLGKSALHINYLPASKLPSNTVEFKISKAQYIAFINYVKNTVEIKGQKEIDWIENRGYWDTDSFYEANGSYGLFNTCNSWVNKGLKEMHQPACLWTPFNPGIFRFYKLKKN